MRTGNRYRQLKINDLQSPHAFKEWAKETMNHLYGNKDIPNSHLLIFVNYIRERVEREQKVDVPFWLDLLRKLKSDIETLKELEENNEL